jgi:tRNA-uridine 2-sulfurtransferase
MKIRALGLLSGGLDSTVAAKILIEQGIEVFAINFTSPFCTCTAKSSGCAAVSIAVAQLGNIPLKRIGLGQDYIDMIKAPVHGYGRNMNPCIDCRILKLKKAAEYMNDIGAKFIFTGEVLGQRPMSQHRTALNIIDKYSGLGDIILRPLSAGMLNPTLPEREGWVDRSKLMSITGRSRRPQIDLALKSGISDYPCASGGCLLTDGNIAVRIKKYFDNFENPRIQDMALLKFGKHYFTDDKSWIIISRNEKEGEYMEQMKRRDIYTLMPCNFSAPVTMLAGRDRKAALAKMNEFTKKEIPETAVMLIRKDGCEKQIYRKDWGNWAEYRI